jgi:hypothetical protein
MSLYYLLDKDNTNNTLSRKMRNAFCVIKRLDNQMQLNKAKKRWTCNFVKVKSHF